MNHLAIEQWLWRWFLQWVRLPFSVSYFRSVTSSSRTRSGSWSIPSSQAWSGNTRTRTSWKNHRLNKHDCKSYSKKQSIGQSLKSLYVATAVVLMVQCPSWLYCYLSYLTKYFFNAMLSKNNISVWPTKLELHKRQCIPLWRQIPYFSKHNATFLPQIYAMSIRGANTRVEKVYCNNTEPIFYYNSTKGGRVYKGDIIDAKIR